jgi:hypothetical protein
VGDAHDPPQNPLRALLGGGAPCETVDHVVEVLLEQVLRRRDREGRLLCT